MYKIKLFLFAGIVSYAPLCVTQAAEEFVPASFSNNESSLQKKIKFPAREGNFSILIVCEATVHQAGRIEDARCIYENGLYNFANAILDVIRHAGVNAASINDQKVPVVMPFSVQFAQLNNERLIKVFPHHFTDYETYGEVYSAAQFYKYESRLGEKICRDGMDTNLWFNIPVDERGIPHDIRFVDQENYSTHCQREALRIHQAHRFIPAFHNGSPVPSTRVHNHFSEGCSGVIERRTWQGDERWCENTYESDRFLEY